CESIDIFCLWLPLSFNKLNIRLTWKYSQKSIDFLDLAISKSVDGTIVTDVICKSTATNALLHFTSSHPPRLKSSIPVGQFMRVRRICSNDGNFHKQARDLTHRFRDRGYNYADIRKGYSRALYSDRPSLLAGPPRKRHWSVLLTDRDLSGQLTPYPLITWHRSRTLGDILCNSHYVPPRNNPFGTSQKGPPWGCFPCGNCSVCMYIPRIKEFTNSAGDKTYKIVHHISCNTEAVVYYAQCPCNHIYIGMTTRAFKICVQEHIRDINNSANCLEPLLLKSIPKHFFEVHHSNPKGLRFCGIDHVYMGIRGGNIKQKTPPKRDTLDGHFGYTLTQLT
ncbi:unnamed protein product, partial [Ranitomeya imitator]